MNWCELKVSINLEAAEAVINLLQEYGARGVITEDIEKSKPPRQIITAYYADERKTEPLISGLKNKIDNLAKFGLDTGEFTFEINIIKDRNWNESWLKYFKSRNIGDKFIICPIREECSAQEKIIIKLDPGQAFGTGSHITTRLAVKLLEKYIENNEIDNILDIGTGTGILSIAAAKLGVKNIVGIDIDRAAVRAAQNNIKINNVDDKVIIKKSNIFSENENEYSLVIANLLPHIILKLLPLLPVFMKEKGTIILSGINKKYKNEILEQLNRQGFILMEKLKAEDWMAFMARKG